MHLTWAKCQELWSKANYSALALRYLPKSEETLYSGWGAVTIANFFGKRNRNSLFELCGLTVVEQPERQKYSQYTWAEIIARINRAIDADIIKYPEDV